MISHRTATIEKPVDLTKKELFRNLLINYALFIFCVLVSSLNLMVVVATLFSLFSHPGRRADSVFVYLRFKKKLYYVDFIN